MPAEFPLPPAQRLFLRPAFLRNSLLSLSFGRELDRARWKSAWDTLVRIHPVLRSALHAHTLLEFEVDEGLAENWLEPDWTAAAPERIAALWEELQENESRAFFPEKACPLWRIHLIKLPGNNSHLLAVFHPGLLDQAAAANLMVQWLNAYDAEPELLAGLTSLPGLAVANASMDPGDAPDPLWPENWRGDAVLEILRPWFWLRPLASQPDATPTAETANPAPHTVTRPASMELVQAIRAVAEENDAAPGEILSLMWAGFWAVRSEAGASFTGHPFDLGGFLAPEHRDILGRLTPLAPFALREAPPAAKQWPAEWWNKQIGVLRRAGGHIYSQPPPNLDEVALDAGLTRADSGPGSAAFWNEAGINDYLHTRLPRWLAADARWTELPALPLSLFMQGGRHPEITLVAHPDALAAGSCERLLEDFLAMAGPALGLPPGPAVSRSHALAAQGTLFSLTSDPVLGERLSDALSVHENRTILLMGESAMSGADLLGCSNQLARFLRRGKMPEGTRFLVNLQPGNWLSLVLLTLVREGLPFLFCQEIIPSTQDAAWFENEKIGCVLLDSATATGWDAVTIRKIVVDAAWEKVGAMSDATLSARKPGTPVVMEFGCSDGTRRTRLGEALLGSSLTAAADFWSLEPGSLLLSTSSPGTPAWLEETLLACFTGATLVHPGQDIFATRSAFQETLSASQITHLALPAIRWSDWVHFLVELRQSLPPSLRRVVVRSGRLGFKAAREWLGLCGEGVSSSVLFSPKGLSSPALALPFDPALPSLLETGLIPLGFPLGDVDCYAAGMNGARLPDGAPGRLRMELPVNAVVDGVAPSTQDFGWRGIRLPGGLICALVQPDAPVENWQRPPAPVAAAAEKALQSRPQIFDAFVARKSDGEKGGSRRLKVWIVPQESSASLPHGLAIWWKNEGVPDWSLEAAIAIAKGSMHVDGTLDTESLPTPKVLINQPSATTAGAYSPAPSSADQSAGTAPQVLPIQWHTPEDFGKPLLLICGSLPHAGVAQILGQAAGEDCGVATAVIPRPGQQLPSETARVVVVAAGAEAWDLLRWFNSLPLEDPQPIDVLLVQPALLEPGAPGLEARFKALWHKMLGQSSAGNARRETSRGVRPVRCHRPVSVLCASDPETALVTYLPGAEFFSGETSTAEGLATAILDIAREEVVVAPEAEESSAEN